MAKKSASDKYKALVGIQFTQVEESVKKLQAQMKPVAADLGKGMKKAFDTSLKQVDILKAELEAAGDEQTFRALEQSMAAVLSNTIKVGNKISEIQGKKGQIIDVGKTNQQVAALKRLRNGLQQVNVAQRRTVMSSQNMLRVIQDSPFGMLGMANNFQMLGEDISRGMAKGESAISTLKAGIKGLIMGPMALAAVVAIGTIIIQKWDVIMEKGQQLKETLDGLSRSQRDFNAAVREFEGSKSLQTWIDSLSEKKARTARDTLTTLRDELASLHPELAKLDIAKITKQAGAIEFLMRMLGQKAPKGIGSVVVAEGFSDVMRQFLSFQDELERYNKKIQQDVREDARLHARGLLTDAELAAAKQLELEEEEARKKAIAQIKLIEKRNKMWRKFRDDDLTALREANKAKIDEEEKAGTEEAKAKHDAYVAESRRLRQAAGSIRRTVRAGVTAASAIGAGVIPRALADAGRAEQISAVETGAAWDKVQIDEKIAVTRTGLRELDLLMQDAHGLQLRELQANKAQMLAEEERYTGDILDLTARSEYKIAEMKKKFREQDLEHMSQMAGSMGGVFGSLASILAKETEDGLKQHRGMLKMAAYADAIAASISVFRGIVWANPLSVAAAFAASAAVLASLVAKIRQIDNPNGPSGGGGGAITGGFVALNQNVAANRAAGFSQDQQRLNQITKGAAGVAAGGMQESFNELADKITDQKVILDSSGMTEATRQGQKNLTRRVQTTG